MSPSFSLVKPDALAELSDGELADLSIRLDELQTHLKNLERNRRAWQQTHEPIHFDVEQHDGIQNPNAMIGGLQLPIEALRLVIPFLEAKDVARFYLLCNKSLAHQVGIETVYKALCERTWPQIHSLLLSACESSYKVYFRKHQAPIVFMENDLPLLDPPRIRADSRQMILALDFWRDRSESIMISEHSADLQELWNTGCTSISVSDPVEVAQLPREAARGWNLDDTVASLDYSRVRLQLFHINDSINAPVLLDSDFHVYRGYPQNGEMTYLQQDRSNGLRLTGRGQWIQHRIKQCRHPKWMGYFGLQFKVILFCERLPEQDPDENFVRYGFTRFRIEATRLHETAHGNTHHGIFRKGDGWEKHGVTLLHLVEELL